MSLSSYKEITLAMLRTGILGYGGGPSVIPLIQHEAVVKYKWINEEEFGEILALANALPGPIATKMAAYLGYQKQGTIGAIIAVLAHILPANIAIIALLGTLYSLKDSPVVIGMIAAVRPVIAVMLGLMAYEFFVKAWKGLGKLLGIGFGLLAFLLLSVAELHPAIVIILFLAYGTSHFAIANRMERRRQRKEHERERGLPL